MAEATGAVTAMPVLAERPLGPVKARHLVVRVDQAVPAGARRLAVELQAAGRLLECVAVMGERRQGVSQRQECICVGIYDCEV